MVFELIIQFVQIIHMNVLQRATLFISTVIVLKSEELNIFIVVYFCDNEDGGGYGLMVTVPRTVFMTSRADSDSTSVSVPLLV